MFLMASPPDTSGYMLAGYALAFGVMLLYVLSLFLRSRSLEQDLSVLEGMDEEK